MGSSNKQFNSDLKSGELGEMGIISFFSQNNVFVRKVPYNEKNYDIEYLKKNGETVTIEIKMQSGFNSFEGIHSNIMVEVTGNRNNNNLSSHIKEEIDKIIYINAITRIATVFDGKIHRKWVLNEIEKIGGLSNVPNLGDGTGFVTENNNKDLGYVGNIDLRRHLKSNPFGINEDRYKRLLHRKGESNVK